MTPHQIQQIHQDKKNIQYISQGRDQKPMRTEKIIFLALLTKFPPLVGPWRGEWGCQLSPSREILHWDWVNISPCHHIFPYGKICTFIGLTKSLLATWPLVMLATKNPAVNTMLDFPNKNPRVEPPNYDHIWWPMWQQEWGTRGCELQHSSSPIWLSWYFLKYSPITSNYKHLLDIGFWVPFLLQIFMCFPYVFIFRFLVFMTTSIFHSKFMHLWGFDFSHVDYLALLLCQRFDKFLKRRHILDGSTGECNWMECRYEH